MELEPGRIYAVRLCSGEIRSWRFEGHDGRGLAWWRDTETGTGFNEAGVLYMWEFLDEGECDG